MPAFLQTTALTRIESPAVPNITETDPSLRSPATSAPGVEDPNPASSPVLPAEPESVVAEAPAPAVARKPNARQDPNDALMKGELPKRDVFITEPAFEVTSVFNSGDPLPAAPIPQPFGAISADPVTLIRELARQRGFSVSADQAIADRRVSLLLNPMPTSKAIEAITNAANLSYTFDGNTLELSGSRKYTLSLPPLSSQSINEGDSYEKRDKPFYEEIAATLTALGAQNVQHAVSGRAISFSAGPEAAKAVKAYARELQAKRVRITYDLWIAEVSDTSDDARGIRWDQLQLSIGALDLSLNGGNTVTDGYNIVTNFSAGGVDIDMIASFLEKEGTVEVVSNPTVALISGSAVRLDDTTTTPYLAFEPIAPTGTDNEDVASVTTGVDTREQVTGIVLELAGDYHSGLVTTQLRLTVSDTLGFVEFQVGDISSQQPRTTQRTITTQISTPPGQTVVIGGIARSSSTGDRQGVPLLGKILPFLFSSEQATKDQKQLVIALVPRIVRFRNGSNDS
jgi:hypothetical protein